MPNHQRLLLLPPEVAHGAGGDALDHVIGVVGCLEQGREGREGIGAPILERVRSQVAKFAVALFERPHQRGQSGEGPRVQAPEDARRSVTDLSIAVL